HPGMVKARAYFERLLVLSPKGVYPYGLLFYLDGLARDLDAMRRLLQRAESADLDLSDTTRQMREHYAGKDEDKERTEQTARLTRQEAVLKAVRQGKKGLTLAVAASDVARTKMNLAELGVAVDADEIVALAEEAHAAAPSVNT